nr:MAG TPA: hypothetical protein [Caudoviricetes sp.]DAS73950.1 MAG TPA: hypothetical protein [Caudoviricetes sp.]DAW75414.1 MAG TPA: hypothetical protein [Caudoviricetes sp.]
MMLLQQLVKIGMQRKRKVRKVLKVLSYLRQLALKQH